jgi:hypothetical protein
MKLTKMDNLATAQYSTQNVAAIENLKRHWTSIEHKINVKKTIESKTTYYLFSRSFY